MPKKALVILADGFEEIEAMAPIDILRRAQIEVTVAGLADIKVKSSRGVNVIADKKFNETDLNFDALVLPGGGAGAKNLAASSALKTVIVDMNKSGKVIAAICASPAVVLAPTGILKGKTATCFPGMEDAFGSETKFQARNVVVDGNLITSRGAGTSIEFALSIVEKLCGKKEAEKVSKAIVLA
jgi:4-methyl-5(b-hydroxyethyl)-thiazole monophosphate biosynthesis